jgi:hypothetical protein
VIHGEPSATTVGENNQRQLRSFEGTILHACQLNSGGRREIAERYIFRFPCAWILDSARQDGIGIEKLDACGLDG